MENATTEIARATTTVRAKWGIAADPGFLTLPFVLLLAQDSLGLKSEDLNVLLNYIAHWHSADRMPFPHSITIAKRMGVSPRTVQRSLRRLQDGGFLQKRAKRHPDDPVAYDVRPLAEMLRPYAEARLKLTPATEFDEIIDDTFLNTVTQKTAEEMFGDFLKAEREETVF